MAQIISNRKNKTELQYDTLPERVSVLEIQVNNLNEKIDDVKTDITNNHEAVLEKLKEMQDTSSEQHGQLAKKINELEGFKNRWVKYVLACLAFLAGAGWISHPSLAGLLKFVGL
jgi:archaellum component FlaD/FlaE